MLLGEMYEDSGGELAGVGAADGAVTNSSTWGAVPVLKSDMRPLQISLNRGDVSPTDIALSLMKFSIENECQKDNMTRLNLYCNIIAINQQLFKALTVWGSW